MASSTTTKKGKATPKADEQSVAVPQQQAKRKPPTAGRRIPVQYTPRIPTAGCPWC